MCAYEHFSQARWQCTTDQRASALQSTRLVCSLYVSLARPSTVTMRWTYNGHPLAPFRTHYPAGTWPLYLKLDSGQPDGAIPGGSLQCTTSVGSKHLSASFVSSGPTGDVVDIDVCSGADIFRYGGFPGFPVCRRDESSNLTAPTAVVCNGVYPLAAGMTGNIDFVAADGTIILPPSPFTVDGPISQGYREANIRTLGPGSYLCRFTLDGKIVAEKPFQVSGNP